MLKTVIFMNEQWNNAIISRISVALFVSPKDGQRHHPNRAYHGFVINNPVSSEKVYYFADGSELHTKSGDVFYLPKGSTYYVDSIGPDSGCWAINFDVIGEISDVPFAVTPKNPESFVALFDEAAQAFKLGGEDRDLVVRKCLYAILLKLRKEQRRNYTPNSRLQLMQPALDRINHNFTDSELSVHELAQSCGVSSTYFRRLFLESFGTAPQKFIIDRRLEYARQLLLDGQFSVMEVAEMCGYSEPCHFSRSFTKRFGVAPKNFIKSK